MNDSRDIEGYYWATYKDYNIPIVVEITWVSWDHTRDGDRYVLHDSDETYEEHEWFKYNFIERIKEPEFPFRRLTLR